MLHSVLTAANDFAAVAPPGLPNPAPVQPPGTNGFTTFMGWVKWVSLAVCIIGLMLQGARMALGTRGGEGGEHANRIGQVIVAVIIIAASASLVGFLTTGV